MNANESKNEAPKYTLDVTGHVEFILSQAEGALVDADDVLAHLDSMLESQIARQSDNGSLNDFFDGFDEEDHCPNCCPGRVTADGTPTTRIWEPFTPEQLTHYTTIAAEGDPMGILMCEVAKLSDDEQDDAIEKLFEAGFFEHRYKADGSEGAFAMSPKGKEMVAQGIRPPIKGPAFDDETEF